jgi:hypothetical protein
MLRTLSCVLLLLSLCAQLQAQAARRPVGVDPVEAPAKPLELNFSGEWETTWGKMTLTQKGDLVEGVYNYADHEAKLTGKVTGQRLTFKYAEPDAAGEGHFILAADGQSFIGKWRPAGQGPWGDWRGTRVAPELVAGPFQGLWQTSYGRMRLWQTGNAVKGVYDFGGRSTLTGTVKDKTLTFTYEQPDGEDGAGTFDLADDRAGFNGTWKTPKNVGGKWAGARIKPQPGKIWLVCLEAPWEHNLAEPEYAFGAMLRSFFTRVPNVQVRHKTFHSAADLKRWCAEVTYLPEPVVLHISSHGTKDGVTVGRETITPALLADCLKDLGHIKLLHFGTCLVAGGDAPKKIYEAMGPSARFPISGYRNSADWAGSAVIDFMYLELVMARGFAPSVAVEQVRQSMTFARDENLNSRIAPAGLVCHEPPALNRAAAAAGNQPAKPASN